MAAKLQTSCFYLLLAGCFLNFPTTETANEYNRYLAHIFQKYGSGGTMSFEGLEHLMYNLGLGHIEFDPTHTIEEHRPNGFQQSKIDKIFDQNTIKIVTSGEGEDDIDSEADEQTTQDILQAVDNGNGEKGNPNGQRKGATSGDFKNFAATDKEVDAITREENIRTKGIMLEFKEMHDPKHRHPRENDATFDLPTLSSNICLSPKSLLRLVVDHEDLHKRKLYKTISHVDDHNFNEEYDEFVNNVRLTPVTFMKLCPALLAQIDQQVCVRPAPLMHGNNPKETLWNAWIYASGSIFILSACGLLGILLVPLMKSVAYQEILKFLVAVAVGTLAGDALMHLLPHALVAEHGSAEGDEAAEAEPHSNAAHTHDNTAIYICGVAFATAVFMYIIENLLPLLKGDADGGHGHSHAGHAHGGHGHNHAHTPVASSGNATANVESSTADVKDVKEINIMLNELKKDKKSPSRPLTPLAFMVIIGDALHNLTDGLAIGAAFATDPVTGMATAFAVLCHELPHELGDFALLLQTGVSLKRAVCLNIVSSVLSFVGMAVGLLIAGIHSSMTQWIYAGTAGSFLYIAFADLVPAMGGEEKRTFKSVFIEIFGIIVGGVIMLLIAVNEDELEKLFK